MSKELGDAMCDFFVAVAHADANAVAQLTSSARIAGRAAILEDGLENLLTEGCPSAVVRVCARVNLALLRQWQREELG